MKLYQHLEVVFLERSSSCSLQLKHTCVVKTHKRISAADPTAYREDLLGPRSAEESDMCPAGSCGARQLTCGPALC